MPDDAGSAGKCNIMCNLPILTLPLGMLMAAAAFITWFKLKRYRGHKRLATTDDAVGDEDDDDDVERAPQGSRDKDKMEDASVPPVTVDHPVALGARAHNASKPKRTVRFHVPSKDEVERSVRMLNSVLEPPAPSMNSVEPQTNIPPESLSNHDSRETETNYDGAEGMTEDTDDNTASSTRRNRFGAGLVMDL